MTEQNKIPIKLVGQKDPGVKELGADKVARNTASLGTRFTVSIDAAAGVTTGISAADRAHTVAVFIDPKTNPADLARPGHIFPLEAQPGGVLKRAGHTEAVVDLCQAAGLYPAGLLCEIMDDDGEMALNAEALLANVNEVMGS